MKRLISVLALVILGTAAWAQNNITDIIRRLDTYRIKAEFSCKVQGDVNLECKGSGLAQGNCFVVKANGIEAYCDGRQLVMVDPEAKEVYIQDAEGLQDYLMSNVGNVKDLRFSELRYLDRSTDMSAFSFDVKKLDSSWAVTDLR